MLWKKTHHKVLKSSCANHLRQLVLCAKLFMQMKVNVFTIFTVAALLCSCGANRPSKNTLEANAKANSLEQTDESMSDETGDSMDSISREVCKNLTVIPQNIPGDNSKNVIHEAVIDVDGNAYDAVQIGKQVWMQTDLCTRHFCDGSPIPHPTLENCDSDYKDFSDTEPYWIEEYFTGKPCLYNWSAVASLRGLCPKGWRVASKQDWEELESYLDNSGLGLKALSSTQWPDWIEYEKYDRAESKTPGYQPATTNNAMGFSAYPWPDYDGRHYGGQTYAAYWTASSSSKDYAWSVKIYGNAAALHKEPDLKGYYYMVRCVKE